ALRDVIHQVWLRKVVGPQVPGGRNMLSRYDNGESMADPQEDEEQGVSEQGVQAAAAGPLVKLATSAQRTKVVIEEVRHEAVVREADLVALLRAAGGVNFGSATPVVCGSDGQPLTFPLRVCWQTTEERTEVAS